MNTEAFKKAIDDCHKSGGGRVTVPPGIFLTGAIHLKSNVNLHLADSSTILFSTNPKDYLPLVFTRWEGMELMNYSALIYAYGQENIAITGNGILDGGAGDDNWWAWNANRPSKQVPARDLLHDMNHKQTDPRTRIFGEGHYLRPNFIQPYNCKNILISGPRIVRSPPPARLSSICRRGACPDRRSTWKGGLGVMSSGSKPPCHSCPRCASRRRRPATSST